MSRHKPFVVRLSNHERQMLCSCYSSLVDLDLVVSYTMDSTEVIDFWFSELGPKDWFRKDAVGWQRRSRTVTIRPTRINL